jgi:tetratricopeptide (TPR) repeat protein
VVKGTWSKIVARAFVQGVLCVVMVLSAPAVAAPADLDTDQRALIDKLTADRALAVANERRIAADEQAALNDGLEAQDRAMRAAASKAAGDAAKLAQLRKQRDGIARQRRELVAALAERDQVLAAEVRAYREVVTGIARSPDPRKRKALQRFADGEEREALVDLDVIAEANRAARIKAVDLAEAAERRPTAWLALQACDNGRVTLDEVGRRFEQLTWLDPWVPWDWIELARLHNEQGRLADARRAAHAAYTNLIRGGDDRERSAVLVLLGDVAMEAGDLKEAEARFEESLAIARKLARDNPRSATAQRNLGISLSNRGTAALKAGDVDEARARFEESLRIASELANDNPTSARARRELGAILERLGTIAVQAGHLEEAEARLEASLRIARELAKDAPTSTEAQRHLGVSLERLGELAIEAGDLEYAKGRFEEALGILEKLARETPTSAAVQRELAIARSNLGDVASKARNLKRAKAWFGEALGAFEKLARDNPTSAVAQRDLSLIHSKLGDLATDRREIQEARSRFEESLRIRRKLAKNDAASAAAQLDLIRSLIRLGTATKDRALLREALEVARGLARDGRLAPRDRGLLELLHRLLKEMH